MINKVVVFAIGLPLLAGCTQWTNLDYMSDANSRATYEVFRFKDTVREKFAFRDRTRKDCYLKVYSEEESNDGIPKRTIAVGYHTKKCAPEQMPKELSGVVDVLYRNTACENQKCSVGQQMDITCTQEGETFECFSGFVFPDKKDNYNFTYAPSGTLSHMKDLVDQVLQVPRQRK